MTYKILDQDNTHVLEIEKIYAEWWVILVNRKTGSAQIMYTKSKNNAVHMFKGVKLPDVAAAMTRWGVLPEPLYKPNYQPKAND